MEKRTTQRIIGVLVAIALLVVLMPLVFSKNDLAQTAAIKAPPFPDQQQPQGVNPSNDNTASTIVITQEMADKVNGVAVSASHQNQQADDQNNAPVPVIDSENQTTAVAQPAAAQPTVEPETPSVTQLPKQNSTSAISQESTPEPLENPSPTANKIPSSTANHVETSTETETNKQETKPSTVSVNPPETISTKPAQQVAEPSSPSGEVVQPHYSVISSDPASQVPAINQDDLPTTPSTVSETTKATTHPVRMTHRTQSVNAHKNDAHLKQSVWVVQMGSFKSKSNAMRLANRLRTAGYKAFLREIKSASGTTQTRVYIGPELKQASAVRLSTKLQQNLNLHGFVMPYKPFEL